VQRGKIPFEVVSDKVAAAESALSAIDKYFADNQMGVSDIEAILGNKTNPEIAKAVVCAICGNAAYFMLLALN